MGEPKDYDPGEHRTHDFTEQRRHYQHFASERAEEAKQKDEPATNLIPVSLTTNCLWPLLLVADVTASVDQEWLASFFSKFPYLYNEGKTYMGPGLRICFGAVGDSHKTRQGGSPDKYYFQAVDFVDDRGAAAALKKLIQERGGGGQAKEDYQQWAFYADRNIHFPKARRKPLMILMGDEAPYDEVTRAEAAKINVHLDKSKITTDEIFASLTKRCSVYAARIPYGNYQERDIHRRWVGLLGDSHVCVMRSSARINDVIFGIMAKETGKIPYFLEEMKNRQTPEQCEEVFSVLEPIFADETPNDAPIESESDEGVETAPLA